jgi:hypothetical protein
MVPSMLTGGLPEATEAAFGAVMVFGPAMPSATSPAFTCKGPDGTSLLRALAEQNLGIPAAKRFIEARDRDGLYTVNLELGEKTCLVL